MPSELTVHAVHDGGMKVTARSGDHTVSMDYPLQPGTDCSSLRPLEVLLASLAGCSANTVVLLLERMKQPVNGLEVTARATRRDEHPTVLTDIALAFTVWGADVQPAAVERALRVAEEQLCPVWCMLKTGTNITASFEIRKD